MYLAPTIARESEWRRIYGPVLLALMVVLCYPMHFGLDRGNIDVWIAALCILYVALLNTRFAIAGSTALGIAIAFKGYPAAFCLLALPSRRYREAILPVALGAVLTFYSFSLLAGGQSHNLAGLAVGMHSFRAEHVLGLLGIRYSIDLYDAMRIITISWTHHLPGESLLVVYNRAMVIFAAVCVYFAMFVPSERWRRVMAICLLAVVFPNVAVDYKLLILLPGLLYFIAEAEKSRRNNLIAACIAGLYIPKNYDTFVVSTHNFRVTVGSLISPVFVLGLIWMVMADKPAWTAALSKSRERVEGWVRGFESGRTLVSFRHRVGRKGIGIVSYKEDEISS